MQAGIGSFYPLMMLSGILWPIEGKIVKNLNEKTYLTEKENGHICTIFLFFI